MLVLSLDTETTGKDVYHGACPYFVTFCDESWNNTYFEWEVDPLTREVHVSKNDTLEIVDLIDKADELILQNSKFDAVMLLEHTLKGVLEQWPWHKTYDTLIAGHLLASNHSKDLTSLGIEYLGIDVTRYETRLQEAVQSCRLLVRRKASPIANWRIARKGLPEMPSAKEKVWKLDSWLPRAVALRKIPGWQKEWLTVTREYANVDSATCLAVHQVQKRLLQERGLWEIYLERLKWLPEACAMERRGVTLSKNRHSQLTERYQARSVEHGTVCTKLAASYKYELSLPKAGSNNSLTSFVFDHLKLPPIYNNTKKKTGRPDLDKNALDEYLLTLPERSKEHRFIRSLRVKRRLDTSIGFCGTYEKFWLPSNGDTVVLHPSLNPTGTDTLRWSSSNPNEQQISKQEDTEGHSLRYLFGPAPGREWWSMDAKNIELRIPAYEANETELIQLFERADEPPYYGSEHLLNFSTVYPDIWEQELRAVGLEKVGPHIKKKYASTWYQRCKNGDFAVGYGAVDRNDGRGTADRTFGRPGSHARLKERFAKKEQLNQYWIGFAAEKGYVETLPDRTVNPVRGYPLLCSRNNWGSIKPTVPLNYHIQSTACWVLGRAMVAASAHLAPYNGYLIMQIHDELVFDMPFANSQGNLPIVLELKQKLDLLGDDLVPRVPIVFGIEYHPETWSEGVTIR